MVSNRRMKTEGGRRLCKEGHTSPPLFTIITAVFNGQSFIENTIQSIINQRHNSFEYIIMDGGSTDATVDIIKKYESHIEYWLSEPDAGISDAFNKGLSCSRGRYINFQGDGDGFAREDALSEIENIACNEMLVAARINRIDAFGGLLLESAFLSCKYKHTLLTRMPFPHQGLFMNRSYFDKYGIFDTSLRFSMDYELLLRSYSTPESVKTTDLVIANWRTGGVGAGRERELFEEYKRIRMKWITLPRLLVGFISDLAAWKLMLKEKLEKSLIANASK